MRSTRTELLALSAVVAWNLSGCAGADGGADGGDEAIPTDTADPNASVQVAATIVDLETGVEVEVGRVVVEGLSRAPDVTIDGSSIRFSVPANSVFHVLAGDTPGYHATYTAALEVGDDDVEGLELFVARDEYLQSLAAAFGAPSPVDGGIVVARAVDAEGAPYAGLAGATLELGNDVIGPYFLDADMQPDPLLSATSESGFLVVFNVEPGAQVIGTRSEASVLAAMPSAPVTAETVTVAKLQVIEGELEPVPETVSFERDVADVFTRRGCVNCHDGGGIGKDLGGLHLNGSPEKMYKEIAREISPIYQLPRIDLQNPSMSLLLTLPSSEDPPDRHPFSTFASPQDRDYRLILRWIEQGARQN